MTLSTSLPSLPGALPNLHLARPHHMDSSHSQWPTSFPAVRELGGDPSLLPRPAPALSVRIHTHSSPGRICLDLLGIYLVPGGWSQSCRPLWEGDRVPCTPTTHLLPHPDPRGLLKLNASHGGSKLPQLGLPDCIHLCLWVAVFAWVHQEAGPRRTNCVWVLGDTPRGSGKWELEKAEGADGHRVSDPK